MIDMGRIDWGAVGSLTLVCLLVGAIVYRQVSPGASGGRRLLITAAVTLAIVATPLVLLALVFAFGGTPEQ